MLDGESLFPEEFEAEADNDEASKFPALDDELTNSATHALEGEDESEIEYEGDENMPFNDEFDLIKEAERAVEGENVGEEDRNALYDVEFDLTKEAERALEGENVDKKEEDLSYDGEFDLKDEVEHDVEGEYAEQKEGEGDIEDELEEYEDAVGVSMETMVHEENAGNVEDEDWSTETEAETDHDFDAAVRDEE